MVGVSFNRFDDYILLVGYFLNDFFYSISDVVSQNSSSVFSAKNQMEV